MSENTTPQSGSRWEPRADVSGAPTPPPVPPAQGVSERTSTDSVPAARSSWVSRARGRGGLLAGALALVLGAGVGGFAVNEVVAQHPDGDRAPFGVGYQPQDAGFPAPPPGAGDDDGGFDGNGFGHDGDGGQLGGGSDDGATPQGSSL